MITASTNLKNLAQVFRGAGHTLFITGGYVRDALLFGASDKTDIDICGAASVEEVKKITEGTVFRLKERNSALGTVAIVADGGEAYEYTRFRRDSYRGGTHTPDSVTFVGNADDDALRRDFTVNAIYYDICADKLFDPVGGINDLRGKLLRTCDKPEVTFGSDGLRLLRLARFACTLGFSIDTETRTAAIKSAHLLKDITRPRINEEFFKILNAEDGATAYAGLKLLKELALLFYIIPELKPSDNFTQNKKWHEYDVLEHTLQAVRFSPVSVRMAALLHDIGKPESEKRHGKSTFHSKIAVEEIVPPILKRFEYSGRRAADVLRLIEHHMYDGDAEAGANKVKRFILNHLDILDNLLAIKQADYLAKGKDSDTCPTVQKWRRIYADMQSGPLTIKDLNITAEELIKETKGIMPQTDTALVLKKLLEAVVIEKIKNDRETLFARAKTYYN